MSHIQLNYSFLLFWSIFVEIHWKSLFLVQKMTISERIWEILRRFVFLNKFEKGQIQRKIRICCKQPFFFQNSKTGQIWTKAVFLLKIRQIQLNYVFLQFLSIFGEIHWKLLFLVKKVTISERISDILGIFFSQQFEKEQIQRKIRICFKHPFCSKQ